MTMTHGESIADELRHAVHGDAWHGPALAELLADVGCEQAMQRPVPAGHNIWELVRHVTSWANIALRRIEGGRPQPAPGEDWPESGEFSEERWKEIVKKMKESHDRLCDVAAALSDEELSRNAPDSPRSIAFMLHGVAQHGAYHGGQIALLKKLVTIQHRRAAL